jgi:energy-coupling factor transporter ATP-binding protein EcfA2
VISFQNVFHAYTKGQKRVETFSGLSLFIERGKFTVVAGSNGSGKTTLLKLIRGLELPFKGEVIVEGLSTKGAGFDSFATRNIGFLLEDPRLQIVAQIVEEDILFSLENLGFDKVEAEERLKWVLSLLEIEHLRKASVENLSEGEIQRVAIAGVLVLKPRLILSDESTAWLDPKTALDVVNIYRKLSREGIAVVHVTHQAQEMILADELIVLGEGRVVASGPPHEVFYNASRLADFSINVPLISMISEKLASEGVQIEHPLLFAEELSEWLN